MIILLIITLTIILLGAILYFLLLKQKQGFGILAGKRIYQDTSQTPGQTLRAQSLPLVGKPDYLIKKGDQIIPVEVKTGKTPRSPYLNHTMQLMAYCLLVEETYGVRPTGGYLRYPNQEFPIAYTKEAEKSVRKLVAEMLEKKRTNEEIHCQHPEHIIN